MSKQALVFNDVEINKKDFMLLNNSFKFSKCKQHSHFLQSYLKGSN